MLAYEGTKKVIRVDMARPVVPKEEMHPELAAAFGMAKDLDMAEQALEQGDVQGAMDVIRRAKAAALKRAEAVKKAAEEAAKAAWKKAHAVKDAAKEAWKKRAAAGAPAHIVVEMPEKFLAQSEKTLEQSEKALEQSEKTLAVIADMETVIMKIVSDSAQKDAGPDEGPAVVVPDEPPAPGPGETAARYFYVVRSTKA